MSRPAARVIRRAAVGLMLAAVPAMSRPAEAQGWTMLAGVEVGQAAELHFADWRKLRTFGGGAVAVERGTAGRGTGVRVRWSLMPVTFDGTKTCLGVVADCADPERRQEVAQVVVYQRRALGSRFEVSGGVGGGWYRRRYVSSSESMEARSEPERKGGVMAEVGVGTRWRQVHLGVRLEGGLLPGVRTGALIDCPAPGAGSSGGECREERRSIGFHRVALGVEVPLLRWGR